MDINFTIKLRCHHRGKNFSVVDDDKQHLITRDCDLELNVRRDYRDQSVLSLFSVIGITPGLEQRVSIIGMSRNGTRWNNYFVFCEFHMKNNLYVDNKTLSPYWEICFNGVCVLNLGLDRKQFEHFPYYFSRKREDFVFCNYHLDADNNHDYWCSRYCSAVKEHNHVNQWRNEPYLPIYGMARKYNFGCFGCSVTRGSGLKKGFEWPALVNRELGSVINLAEGALGADGIFLNLRCGLKEFNLDRVVILWPDLNRQCLRHRVDDCHLRVPMTVNSFVDSANGKTIWLSAEEYQKAILVFKKRCVNGWVESRSRKIIARTIKILREKGIQSWHSSWSEETYSCLGALGLKSGLLPPFPKSDKGAMDGSHPSEHQHRSWYESIKKQIGQLE